MRIPTPVPKHLGARIKRLFRGSIGMALYRLALLGVTTFIIVAAATMHLGFLGVFLITGIIAALWMDDIVAVLHNIWDADFATIDL